MIDERSYETTPTLTTRDEGIRRRRKRRRRGKSAMVTLLGKVKKLSPPKTHAVRRGDDPTTPFAATGLPS
jgi:hypothetical protein